MSYTKAWKRGFLVVILTLLCASSFAQAQKVTVNVTNAPLSQVIQQIERQTNYRFSYRDVVLDNQRNVTVNLKDATVQEVLNETFSGRNLSYNILSDRSIVVYATPARQDRNVPLKGTVKDSRGEPVIGAGVVVAGSPGIGTVTDEGGNWSLNVTPGASLQISSLGFKTSEIKV
ncbi:MAG: secretin and TonB N-terminal domain-containing protein, partial [Bacteroidales bacterium]|nr:secretin and TonB N-terminal domain-containing protein [Bacteroidales bacterium]